MFFSFFHEKCTFPPKWPVNLTRSYDKVTSVFVSSRNQTSISIIHTLFSCTSLFPPDYYKGCERNLINFSYQTKFFFFLNLQKKKCFLGNCKQFCGFFLILKFFFSIELNDFVLENYKNFFCCYLGL